MFHKRLVYYVHSKGLPSGILSIVYYYVHCGFIRWCRLAYVRGIGFLDVKGCVKFFGAVFRGVFAWEKSMLSALGFLIVVSPDCGRYLFGVVDGGFYLG
jgi:hypothetical protein